MPVDLTRVLPNEAPSLRAARPRDLPQLADWINRGRHEGRFAGPPAVTPTSLKRYFSSLSQESQKHTCWIIEQAGVPIGYANFVASGARGELLGLYLEPSARGARLGPYLIRRATAELRTLGCREVSTKVFHDNLPSLRACAAAGLTGDHGQDVAPVPHRGRVLRRRLQPLRATTPRFQATRG